MWAAVAAVTAIAVSLAVAAKVAKDPNAIGWYLDRGDDVKGAPSRRERVVEQTRPSDGRKPQTAKTNCGH